MREALENLTGGLLIGGCLFNNLRCADHCFHNYVASKFYRATLCVNAVFAIAWCPSVSMVVENSTIL